LVSNRGGFRQGGLFPERRYVKRIQGIMTFAVPVSLFKSISIIFGAAGLIFED
jgi:hypothetical protein